MYAFMYVGRVGMYISINQPLTDTAMTLITSTWNQIH